MKKKVSVSILTIALAGAMTVGAGAATVARRVTAEVRPDIAVQVDGVKQTLLDKDGGQVYPITYDGATYLPVRALGGAVGLEVEWNDRTQTVNLYTAAEPQDLTLEKLTQRTRDVEEAVSGLRPASDYAGRRDQYDLHSAAITALRNDVDALDRKSAREYRDGTLSAADYRTLSAALDALDDRLDTARDSLAGKTLDYGDGDSGKTEPSTGATYQGYLDQIGDLDRRAAKLAREAEGSADSTQTRRELERKIDALDDEIDDLEDAIKRDYRAGKLTAAEYRALDRELDRVDDDLDDLDDRYDDDWDDDHDRHHDWDD